MFAFWQSLDHCPHQCHVWESEGHRFLLRDEGPVWSNKQRIGPRCVKVHVKVVALTFECRRSRNDFSDKFEP